MKLSPYTKTIMRVVISVGLILILIYTQDIEEIKKALTTFNIWYFPLAFISIFIGTIISSLRWKSILSASDVDYPTKKLFYFYLKGYFYNNFLPTQMGGDVYKAVALGRDIGDNSISTFSVFMDRFSGLMVLIILSLFGVSIYKGLIFGLFIGLSVILGIIIYFPLLSFLSKKIKFFKKFQEASQMLLNKPSLSIRILLLSFMVQIFSYAQTAFIFMGFGIFLSISDILLTMPIASLSLLIPSINGFGVQEFAYLGIFSVVAVPTTVAIATSILITAIRLILSLLGGIFIVLGVGSKS